MKKDEIINEINKLKIDKDEFWVIGSASLVLRDIIDSANDIDLALTTKGYNELKEQMSLTYLGENYNLKWYRINDYIEFCIDIKSSNKVDSILPFNLLNLEYYYNNHLANSVREKDREKKELVEKIINKKD